MSETITDEDSLISQDDIDKLLSASSMEEAEDNIGSFEEEEAEMGELSQDDIDSLMNGSLPRDDAQKDLGAESGDGDDLELVSQDDIDKLMNSGLVDVEALEEPDMGAEEEGDLELISQDDIGRLIGNGAAAEPSGSAGIGEKSVPVSNRADALGSSGPGQAEKSGSALPYDEPIDASEATDIQGCLITQETLDRIMEGDAALPETEPEQGPLPIIDLDADAGAASEKDGAFDTFLETELDEEIEEWSSEGQDISQDDIDNLLKESDDEDASDSSPDEALISQEDINDLLSGSLEEDEDFLGDGDNNLEALEGLDLDGEGAFEEEEHKVVLEESQERPKNEIESFARKDDAKSKKKWYRSKLLLAALVAMLVLIIGLPVGYFTLFTGDKKMAPPVTEVVTRLPEPGPAPAVPASSPVIEVKSIDINLQDSYVRPDPGTVDLKNFVVLAPAKKEGFGYITADFSLDYSNIKAFHAIEKQLPRYRGIIYDAIQQALNSDKKDKVTETELLRLVKDALNGALPENYIEKVSFITFKTG